MEPIWARVVHTFRKGLAIGNPVNMPLALIGAALLLSGCVVLPEFLQKSGELPKGQVCQIVATWNKEVVFPPDPVNGGRPSPGLAGRLYLFGRQIDFPLAGDGSLTVDLNCLEDPADRPPRERWQFDRDNLTKLLRKDVIGWGYTLFLPWGTYQTNVSQVRIKVRYDPPQGAPLFTECHLTLNRAKGS
jgi:hypothetical protein